MGHTHTPESKRDLHSPQRYSHIKFVQKRIRIMENPVSTSVPTHAKEDNKQLEISDFEFILLLFCIKQLFLHYLYVALRRKRVSRDLEQRSYT